MRFVIPLLFLLISGMALKAEDQLLIPQGINALLPKISAGMSSNQVQRVFSSAFPKVKGEKGGWAQVKETGTGWLSFRLDERYVIDIWAKVDSSQQAAVHPDINICLFDYQQHHRICITGYYWQDSHATAKKEQENKP